MIIREQVWQVTAERKSKKNRREVRGWRTQSQAAVTRRGGQLQRMKAAAVTTERAVRMRASDGNCGQIRHDFYSVSGVSASALRLPAA